MLKWATDQKFDAIGDPSVIGQILQDKFPFFFNFFPSSKIIALLLLLLLLL